MVSCVCLQSVFLVFVSDISFYDESTTYYLRDSGITITPPVGTEGSLFFKVHTDPSPFLNHIPQDECLIAPILDCFVTTKRALIAKAWFILQIPHCLSNKDFDAESVVVRKGNVDFSNVPFQKLVLCQRENDGFLHNYESFYLLDVNNILIYVKSFSQFVCTSCKLVCHGQGQAFVFGKIAKNTDVGTVTSLRLYTCSPLYIIKDYKEVNANQSFL